MEAFNIRKKMLGNKIRNKNKTKLGLARERGRN